MKLKEIIDYTEKQDITLLILEAFMYRARPSDALANRK